MGHISPIDQMQMLVLELWNALLLRPNEHITFQSRPEMVHADRPGYTVGEKKAIETCLLNSLYSLLHLKAISKKVNTNMLLF